MDFEETLTQLGFQMGEEKHSRAIMVLRAALNAANRLKEPISFGNIYDQVHEENPDFQPTKTWVHRILKGLVDDDFIRVEDPDASRKRYITNVGTVASGIEQLKMAMDERLQQEKERIDEQLDWLKIIDCGNLAEKLVFDLTGEKQVMHSRVIKGVEELHRVLLNNIHGHSVKGDTLRETMMFLGPFVYSASERLENDIDASKRGVDVRWLVSFDVLRTSFDIYSNLPIESFRQIVFHLRELYEDDDIKFDVRLYKGPQTYNHVALNDQRMTLIITENPMTATYMIRDFNAELIDDVIKHFDKNWEEAISLFELKATDLKKLNVPKDSILGFVLT